MLKAWNWLSGKKTIIGATLGVVAVVLIEFFSILSEEWGINYPWSQQLTNTLLRVSAIMSGAGLVHKTVK